MAGALGKGKPFPRRRGPRPPQALHPGHVPVPVRRGPARGPPGGVHGHGHPGPHEAHAGLQRAAPHGLGRLRPARGKLRHPEQGPPAPGHPGQHRQLPAADQVPRVLLRLVPGGGHHRPRVLQMDPVDLPPAPQEGAGVRRRDPHQFLPQVQDRPGQRGGAPGRLRTLRRARGTAGHAPMAAQDHGVRGPPAGRPGRPGLARVHPGHATELDRPFRGRGGGL